jgi:hypothetical protein
MVCYTCAEAKLIKEGRSENYEVNVDKMNSLRNLLANFQANRPS